MSDPIDPQKALSFAKILAELDTATNDAWLILDADGLVLALNDRAAELHGRCVEEIIGGSVAVLRAAESLPELQKDLDAACDGGALYETAHVRADGSTLPVEVSAKSTLIEGDCVIFAMIRDISERKSLIEELMLKSVLLDSTVDLIIVHTVEGLPLYMNAPAYEALGIKREELPSADAYFWIGPRYRMLGPSRNETILAQGHHTFEGDVLRSNGSVFPAEVTSSVLQLPSGTVIVSVLRDMTARLHAEEAVRHLAYHDPLTGLANRTQMRDQLTLAIASTRRHGDLLGVAYLDLDGFKPINDSLGHAMGDRALAIVSDRLRASVRAGDTVARLGGDEFAVVLPRIADAGDLEYAAKKLYDAVAQPMSLDDNEITVTASIGLALFDPDCDDVDSLLIKADLAMYSGRRQSSCGWEVYRESVHGGQVAGR